MKFITQEDLNASVHSEIVNAITRQDNTILDILEQRALEQMVGYLSARYDTQKLFNATAEQRSSILVSFAIDILLYHLFSAHNPQKMGQNTIDRYDRALEWLQGVQAQTINPVGFPARETAEYILSSSNHRNVNHF